MAGDVDDPGPPARRPDLRGRTVGVTADRRGEEQALMFRRLGAEVVHGPTLATHLRADDAALRRATEAVIAAPPDVVVANTGLGVRTWMAAAEEWGLRPALVDALRRSRIVCRGPKADGAIKSAGLTVSWRAPSEQLAEVVDHLLTGPSLAGASVVVQLHGAPSPQLSAALSGAGAAVLEVPVYTWSAPGDTAPAQALVDACVGGRLDAVTFTAGPQVHGLVAVAEADGRAGALLDGLNRGVVGCIGPVCAAAAEEEGVVDPVVPGHWRLGALVTAVAVALTG